MNQNKIEKYFEEFKGNSKAILGEAFKFGVDPDKLAALVVRGEKTLTCSLKILYEYEDEELPSLHKDKYDVVLNGRDEPVCIIKTKKIYEIKFSEADESIAIKEGEGDKTLAYWKKSHREFFENELKKFGKTFEEDMLIVVEEFECVYV